MITWHTYIGYCVYIVLLLNVLIYWISFKNHSDSLKWFTYYLSTSFGITVLAKWLGSNGINNLSFLHLFSLLEFILLSIFYKKVLIKEPWFQKWINYAIAIGVLLMLMNTLLLQPLNTFNSNAKGLSQAMFMVYAIAYYFSILHKRTKATPVLNLLNAAILIYYAGSFFIFMFSNMLSKNLDNDSLALSFIFNALIYLVFQLIVIFAGWKAYLTTKKSIR